MLFQIETTIAPIGPDYVFSWNGPAPDCIVTGANGQRPTVSCSGIYELIVQNPTLNLADTLLVEISEDLMPPLLLIATTDTISCIAPQETLDASGSDNGPNFLYEWLDDDGNNIGNLPVITTSTSGQFTLEITNTDNGCRSVGTIEVFENTTIPEITFEQVDLPCYQDSFLLTATLTPLSGRLCFFLE